MAILYDGYKFKIGKYKYVGPSNIHQNKGENL